MRSGGWWAVAGDTIFTSLDGVTWTRAPLAPGQPYVLDANHIWTVEDGPRSTPFTGSPTDVLNFVVHSTSDGGRTWRSTPLDGNFAGTTPRLVFIDPDQGFLLCAPERHSAGVATVLKTTDGGTSWERTGSGAWLGSMFAASDAETLWTGAQPEAGPVERDLIQMTRDAGKTWTSVKLPGLAAAKGPTFYLAGPPAFLNPSTGGVAVVSDADNRVQLFTTSDAGSSWEATGTLSGVGGDLGTPSFLDPHDWLVPAPGSSISVTTDGGVSWRALTPVGLPGGLIEWLSLSDHLHGLALIHAMSGEVLYRTADGGQSWTSVSLR